MNSNVLTSLKQTIGFQVATSDISKEVKYCNIPEMLPYSRFNPHVMDTQKNLQSNIMLLL